MKMCVDFVVQHKQNAHEVQTLSQQVTNGQQGTISHKTQQSIRILCDGLADMTTHFDQFYYMIDVQTLLTCPVENLHVVSYMKHTTFSVLDHARDFGQIVKESIKCITSWSAKYFTHRDSYYSVPYISTPLTDVTVMTRKSTPIQISKERETKMMKWVETYHPIWQRTVRDETTKDKAGTYPIEVYANQKKVWDQKKALFTLDTQESDKDNEESDDDNENIEVSEDEDSEDDEEANKQQESEYDSESEDDQEQIDSDSDDSPINARVYATRSGRRVQAVVCPDYCYR